MSFNIRFCLIDSFKEVVNKSDEPREKNQARIGISLLILGIVLTILGVVFTALLLAGALPSLSPFIFPSIALIGLILTSIGTVALVKRYKIVTKFKNDYLKTIWLRSQYIFRTQEEEIKELSLTSSFSTYLSKLDELVKQGELILKANKEGSCDYRTAKSKLLQILTQCESYVDMLRADSEALKNPTPLSI